MSLTAWWPRLTNPMNANPEIYPPVEVKPRFRLGQVVRVGKAFAGRDDYGRTRYAADGHEGVYTVVGVIGPTGLHFDYKLARGAHGDPHANWDLIVTERRLTAARASRASAEARA